MTLTKCQEACSRLCDVEIQGKDTDGFSIVVNDRHDDFVDHVVPGLHRRGLRPDDYQGLTTTLVSPNSSDLTPV